MICKQLWERPPFPRNSDAACQVHSLQTDEPQSVSALPVLALAEAIVIHPKTVVWQRCPQESVAKGPKAEFHLPSSTNQVFFKINAEKILSI